MSTRKSNDGNGRKIGGRKGSRTGPKNGTGPRSGTKACPVKKK